MTQKEFNSQKAQLELEQLQLENEIKKAELEAAQNHQEKKEIFNPILLSIIGGIITIFTGLILKHYENNAALLLEDKKSQSALLVQAAETKNYDDFVNLLDAFSSGGFIEIDSTTIEDFKKKRLRSDFKAQQTRLYYETTSVVSFLTVSTDFKSELFQEKLARFWQLYWVELSAVESEEVEIAMVSFGNVLEELDKGNYKNYSQLKHKLRAKGLKIAQVIKASLNK